MALPYHMEVFLPILYYGSSITTGIFTTVTKVVPRLVTTDHIRSAHLRGHPLPFLLMPSRDLRLALFDSPTPRRPQNRPRHLPPQSVSDEIPPIY